MPLEVVRTLLARADRDVHDASAAAMSAAGLRALHKAEQIRLLLQLAADTDARRGELDALHPEDLHGRLLHIERGVSDEVMTSAKTGRSRRVTVGAGTASLWHDTVSGWRRRLPAGQELGRWLFSADLSHGRRLRAGSLSHWFAELVDRHGHRGVCLHALRHTVATLLADGQLLQAQQRPGHAEASTTLRQYCHALPLHDVDTADHLEALLGADADSSPSSRGRGRSVDPFNSV